MQPVTKLQAGTSPVIFKQQQVVVQQMTPQSYVKSNAQSIAGGTHIQHIITSLPVTASASSTASAAGVLTSQIVGQAGATATTVAVTPPQVTFTKTLSLTITTTAITTSKYWQSVLRIGLHALLDLLLTCHSEYEKNGNI